MSNTIVLRLQLQLRGTLTQPFHPDMDGVAKRNKITHNGSTNRTYFAAPKPDLDAKAKKRQLEARFKRNLKRKIINAKMKKSAAKAPFHAAMNSKSSRSERISSMQQFRCTKCFNTCKTQKHSIIKEEKKSPWTIRSTARAKKRNPFQSGDA